MELLHLTRYQLRCYCSPTCIADYTAHSGHNVIAGVDGVSYALAGIFFIYTCNTIILRDACMHCLAARDKMYFWIEHVHATMLHCHIAKLMHNSIKLLLVQTMIYSDLSINGLYQ